MVLGMLLGVCIGLICMWPMLRAVRGLGKQWEEAAGIEEELDHLDEVVEIAVRKKRWVV